MQTMKAICFPGPNRNPEMMEIPVPTIDANEILIRMHTVGVGLHDRYPNPMSPGFPYALGMEGAGTVEEAGSAVTDFKPGDRVMVSGMFPKGGTWAEFAAVSAEVAMPIPDGLGFEEAAALPIPGNTALAALKTLNLQEGDSVFIAGASGAIGTIAIQIASKRGCHVAASASPPNHDYMKSLGAELAVDYRDPNWAEKIRDWMPGGVDAALAIQPGTGQTSQAAVRDGGRVVTVSGDRVRPERNIEVQQFMHSPDTRQDLVLFASDVVSGGMRVVVEQVYPFEQAVMALERTERRHAQGKVVLSIREK